MNTHDIKGAGALTRKRLELYAKLKSEIKILERQIQNLINQRQEVIGDSVMGCTPDRIDYHVIPIRGFDNTKAKQLTAKTTALETRRSRLEKMTMEIDDFIDSISDDDSEIRQIITLRYIEGQTWRKVVKEMYGGYGDETMPLQKVKRYFVRCQA